MPDDKEIFMIQKAAVYDLIDLIESNTEKQTYTPEEIKALMKAYVKGTERTKTGQ